MLYVNFLSSFEQSRHDYLRSVAYSTDNFLQIIVSAFYLLFIIIMNNLLYIFFIILYLFYRIAYKYIF